MRNRVALAILLVAILVGLGFANYRLATQAPGGNDFLARWVGARAWVVDGLSPYDPQVSLTAQRLIYGRPADPQAGEDIAHFAYPLPAMMFFAPFGLLPYTLARSVWTTLLQIGLVALAFMGASLARWSIGRRMTVALVLFSIFWYHGFRAQILGQFAVIEAVLMIGALLAVQRRSDPLAGILLACAMTKPQMAFLLVPFIIIWALRSGRGAIVGWSVGSSLAILGVSLALMPSWPLQWVAQLLDYPNYTRLGSPISIMANISQALAPQITVAMTGLALLYLLWEWLQAFGKPDHWFQWTAALTLVITNLVAYRTATTNYVVLLPSLAITFAVLQERWGRRASLPILIGLVLLLAGLWALFIETLQGNRESAWMYIPVPLISLIGLWWSRWWKVRQASLREILH